MNDTIRMQISAFVDGELPDNESELLLRRMSHDIELREQAAEFFAIGRLLRGQRNVAELERLRERVAAAIDDKDLQDEFDAIEPPGRRYVRPVAGVVIAATVALAAILGLQQVLTPEVGSGSTEIVADTASSNGYVVPPPEAADALPDDALWQYRAIHSSGASNIDARLMPLQRRENALVSPASARPDADAEADASRR